MQTGTAIKTIATLVTIAVGGITIYQFVKPGAQEGRGDGSSRAPPPPTLIEVARPPEPSFLEKVSGSYSLTSWVAAQRPVELGAKIPEGTLRVQGDGIMDWSVLLVQTYASNPGRVQMTARGKIQVSTQRVMGVPGGESNNTRYLDARWGQVSPDVTLAVRGWDTGQPEDPFQLAIDQGSGRLLLEMTNSRGTFTWTKQ